jgi:uncharacterized membrane protein
MAYRSCVVDIFTDIFFWFLLAITVVAFPIVGAVIAQNKGRNARAWFLGILLFPLSGLLILVLLPPRRPDAIRGGGVVADEDVHI